ncbi:MAG: SUMF1/EgtB/PvdO family nonheme iron enzyme [Steroidobacteraceae bacterium]
MHLREPAGERDVSLPCRIGGSAGYDIVVPSSESDSISLDRVDGQLGITLLEGQSRLNGVLMRAREFYVLQRGDVVAIGQARLVIQSDSSLEIRHLLGNATITPITGLDGREIDEFAKDERISAARLPTEPGGDAAVQRGRIKKLATFSRKTIAIGFVALAVFGLFAFQLGRLEPVRVTVTPEQAEISGSGFGWRSAGALLLLPGERTVRAELEGFESIEQSIIVRPDAPLALDLRLKEKPGIIEIDTGGVAAQVFVDGAELGKAPGPVEVMGGSRTLLLRADRHLDHVAELQVEGRGVRQPLSVRLAPSWGVLEVSATTVGAKLVVEDASAVALPARVDLPAGVHRLTISANGAKTWQSAVLLKAGEVERIGPVELGAPDARLRVTSRPTGAEVTVSGVFRGRTPVTVELPAGIDHEIGVSLQGYEPLQRRVFAESNRDLSLPLTLRAIPVRLTIQGDPADSDVVIEGVVRGKTPLTLDLPARRHTLEIRKTGLQPERLDVDLSAAVERTVEYRLVPVGRAKDWKPPSPALRAQTGTLLRLIEGGAFVMGSERREQGRRANEFSRRVTLSRPFYLGTREVTNGEFKRFKPAHASGFVGQRTLDLDNHPVSNVTWIDAVQYCNWLSAQEGLPAAYEQKGGVWVLVQPINTGYRLPTEAEWEYVARHPGPGSRTQRYEWGDSLPPPAGIGNLAGQEAVAEMPRVLEGWTDDYVVVAPPGKFRANAFGIFDMTGNVSEWVHDTYVSFEANAGGVDPTGPSVTTSARKVIKGSNWRTTVFADLRSAWREGGDSPSQDVGFRVARYAE